MVDMQVMVLAYSLRGREAMGALRVMVPLMGLEELPVLALYLSRALIAREP